MLCIPWNCRGAGKESFGRSAKYLIRHHSLDVIVFFEMQISGDRSKKGRAGGLIVLWDSSMVSLNISRLNQNFITAIAKKGLTEFTFFFAYAPPTHHRRTRFWQEIGVLFSSEATLAVLSSLMRDRGSGLLHQDSYTFQELVDEVGILDMRFTGQPHTWSNRAPVASFVAKRLDRIVMSIDAFISWPNASVRHLPKFGSDHMPLLFELEPRGRARNDRHPFRFEAMWLTHPDFLSFIRDFYVGTRWCLADTIIVQEAAAQRELAEVLKCEEILWRQKSRDSWLKDGDRNTSFFHISTLVHRHRNRVSSLLDDADQWIHNPRDLEDLVVGHFHDIYTVPANELHPILTPYGLFPPLEASRWAEFSKEFSNDEIVGAVRGMGGLKALGSDDFQPIFYHRCWEHVGESVILEVRRFFTSSRMPMGMNETYITLIPKTSNSVNVNQFCPIILCNVIYKIITKKITNRLQKTLSNLIGPTKSGFLPGRLITDDIVLAQEVIHTLKKKQGKRGYMIMKIDLEKAYDRLRWDFISDMLYDAGFHD
ncbi:hypothetical protein V2J09_020635 [Rumex salicifolius]